jgi:predicted phosphodiesterase
VPFVPTTNKKLVVALACGDLHFSLKAPTARSDNDWLESQERYIDELKNLSMYANGTTSPNVPILCTGDVFDKWCPPIELVNFLLHHLPVLYCIAGNHDLPYHDYEGLHKSALYTLYRAGRVILVPPKGRLELGNLVLHGFPYGFPVESNSSPSTLCQDIAMVHSYIWTKDTGHPGAPEEKRLGKYKDNLKNYDIALFGDNHKTITYNLDKSKEGPSIFNPGSFMRRKSDEIDHSPVVGMIYEDSTIKLRKLDTSQDKFTDFDKLAKVTIDNQDMVAFLEKLKSLGDMVISFEEAVKNYLRKHSVPKEVRRVILAALEEDK